jgi:hypothetical protein
MLLNKSTIYFLFCRTSLLISSKNLAALHITFRLNELVVRANLGFSNHRFDEVFTPDKRNRTMVSRIQKILLCTFLFLTHCFYQDIL